MAKAVPDEAIREASRKALAKLKDVEGEDDNVFKTSCSQAVDELTIVKVADYRNTTFVDTSRILTRLWKIKISHGIFAILLYSHFSTTRIHVT